MPSRVEKKELDSLEYLIKRFQKVKGQNPVIDDALKMMEEQREASQAGKTQSQGAPSLGRDDALVTIVEFMDFQCPPCKKASETVKEILTTQGDKARLVFRNFPRVEKHPYAVKAAEAAFCAHDQGKFWEYSKLLFENQRDLGEENLVRLAKEIGLDAEAFKSCLLSGVHGRRIIADMQLGRELGVARVPTFFINGIKIEGSKSKEDFLRIIEKVLS